jgi:PAS domain S-box-containing protein
VPTDQPATTDTVRRLAAIVESSDDAIVSMNIDGTVVSWNRGAELLYGYSASDAIGRSILIVVPEERHDELWRLFRRLTAGERVPHHETVRMTRAGVAVEVALSMSPVLEGTRVVGISTIARDITEQRWLASTLDRALGDLQEALSRSQAAEARSRRFLADAAHQLRAPLASIQLCAETLGRPLPPGACEDVVADLRRETARAAKLISAMLKMARFEEGAISPSPCCDVASVAAAEVALARSRRPTLPLAFVTAPGTVATGPFDPTALGEAFANLLDNAQRHACTEVTLSVEPHDGSIEVRVSDDGPGVPEDATERIFERFVSLDGRGGSGLGLAIARAAARAHGGDLTYEAPAFVLRLPGNTA